MNVADHVLKNTQATLAIDFTAGAATGAVTYTVTDADGTAVTSGSATHGTAGAYSFTLPPQTAVKSLTIVWTGTWGGVAQSLTTYAEIVGNHLFTIAEARAFDNAALASVTDYPEADIRAARAGIADFFESVTDVSFIPRYGRKVLDGPGARDLWLPVKQLRTLLAASVAGTAFTASEIADVEVYEYGKLYRPSTWDSYVWGEGAARRNVTVAYEHGYQSVPWDIHQAALVYLRYLLVASDISDRTVSWSNELGTFRQAVPGRLYPTGLPSVDAALGRYQRSMVLA